VSRVDLVPCGKTALFRCLSLVRLSSTGERALWGPKCHGGTMLMGYGAMGYAIMDYGSGQAEIHGRGGAQ
jgi:hypothetical protein